MIVTKDGLKYGAQPEEYIINEKLNQDVDIDSDSSPYNWKIPYEEGVLNANFISCFLDYEFQIQTENDTKTCVNRDVQLKLGETHTTEGIDDGSGHGTFPIGITLTKNDNDRNFIIAIQFNSAVANVKHAFLWPTITYQSDPYCLLLKTVGEAEIHGNLDIRGDVSIGGSLTIPSDKGIEVGELTGSSIDIGSMTGGTININAITGGSLNCKVSEIGDAATSLEKGCLYYVPTQSFDDYLTVSDYTSGSTGISGFILYYFGEPWELDNWFFSEVISKGVTEYYRLVVSNDQLLVKKDVNVTTQIYYNDWVKYYKLPITITF